jgi:hypothetical protein
MVHTLYAPRHEELSFGGMETGVVICGTKQKPYSCKGCTGTKKPCLVNQVNQAGRRDSDRADTKKPAQGGLV